MNQWSISFSYRLGLGFHALNNEGSDGSNVMQPRRIDVGTSTYDGVSGEICRRHILEKFVNICRQDDLPMLPLSRGLHPDRGPLGIRGAAKSLGSDLLDSRSLYLAAREAVKRCAVLDVGGYLAAWKDASDNEYTAEQEYIRKYCAAVNNISPVKRDSRFDVGWLISEKPQDITLTQHSTYRDSANKNSLWVQTMRSNVYGGVIRINLHQIGMDDHWYLQPEVTENSDEGRLAVSTEEQLKRQIAIVKAVADFIASPSGAKTAGWAPHVFLTEGVVLLSSKRTAPFISPILVELNNGTEPVSRNSGYAEALEGLANKEDLWAWRFQDIPSLFDVVKHVENKVGGEE